MRNFELPSNGWRRCARRGVVGLAAGALTIAGLASWSQVQAQDDDRDKARDKVMLVFDASGSMRAQMGDETRIDVARRVVKGAARRWHRRGMETGLVVYGHRDKNSCTDIQTLVPAGEANVREFRRIVDTIEPKGRTPLADAIRRAARNLNYQNEKATVVLISDGRENCRADPCAVAQSLKRRGANFVTHVVGFAVRPKDEDGLRCIAQKTGGVYVSADDAGSLDKALLRVAKKVRPSFDEYVATAELLLPKLKPGTYRLVIRETGTEGGFTATADLLKKKKPIRVKKPIAELAAPRQVVARESFTAEWSGPNLNGDRIELIAYGEKTCDVGIQEMAVHEYDRSKEGQLRFLAPIRAGDYELVYCSIIKNRVLARQAIKVVASKRDLTREPEFFQSTRATARPIRIPRVETRRSVQLNSDGFEPAIVPEKQQPAFDQDDDEVTGFFSGEQEFENEVSRDVSKVEPSFEHELEDLIRQSKVRKTAKTPLLFEDDDLSDVDNRRSDPSDTEVGEAAVIDIAPRKKPLFGAADKPRRTARTQLPRPAFEDADTDAVEFSQPQRRAQRPSFLEDAEPARTVQPSLFDDDDFVKVTKPKERRSRDQATVKVEPKKTKRSVRTARAPSFGDVEDQQPVRSAPQPSFDDDVMFAPLKRTDQRNTFESDVVEKKSSPSKRVPSFGEAEKDPVKTASRSSFDDETDTLVERDDDFKTDDIGVAQAIARNKARYGDDGDDYFTIRDRYSWYKPVTVEPSQRTSERVEPTFEDRLNERRAERKQDQTKERRGADIDTRPFDDEDSFGQVIELGARDNLDGFLPDRRTKRRSIVLPKENDLNTGSTVNGRGGETAVFGPPVADEPWGNDFDSSTGSSTPETEVAMIPLSRSSQVAPQFDRIQPVRAGYAFAAGWTGKLNGSGWVSIAAPRTATDDYLTLKRVTREGEVRLRAPSKAGRYELRFLSQDRRQVLARQSFEVEAAPVRLVALEFVDAADELNVWWAGPGDKSDVLTVARAGTRDSRYLTKQSVGKGNPLTIKAPSQPGTYEMRYVNGADNRVMYRRKLIVAARQPQLLGP